MSKASCVSIKFNTSVTVSCAIESSTNTAPTYIPAPDTLPDDNPVEQEEPESIPEEIVSEDNDNGMPEVTEPGTDDDTPAPNTTPEPEEEWRAITHGYTDEHCWNTTEINDASARIEEVTYQNREYPFYVFDVRTSDHAFRVMIREQDSASMEDAKKIAEFYGICFGMMQSEIADSNNGMDIRYILADATMGEAAVSELGMNIFAPFHGDGSVEYNALRFLPFRETDYPFASTCMHESGHLNIPYAFYERLKLWWQEHQEGAMPEEYFPGVNGGLPRMWLGQPWLAVIKADLIDGGGDPEQAASAGFHIGNDGGIYPSNYGITRVNVGREEADLSNEDFAESYSIYYGAQYLGDDTLVELFRSYFPHRAALLDYFTLTCGE